MEKVIVSATAMISLEELAKDEDKLLFDKEAK